MQNIQTIKALLKHPLFLKYQAVILPAISVIVCLIIIALFLIPQFSTLQSNRRNLTEIQEKTRFYIGKTELLKKINPKNYKDNLEAALVELPNEPDIPGIIGQIISIVSSINLTLDGMAFANPSSGQANISNYQIKLEVTGNMTQIKKLIEDIKLAPRVIKVTAIEISGTGASDTKVQASLQLTTYFQPLPTQVGGLDQQVTLISTEDQKHLTGIRNSTFKPSDSSNLDSNTQVGKTDPFR